jgi:hypothetical protein
MPTKKKKPLNKGYEKFIDAAGTKRDEVTMILRSHLLVEYYLDHVIILEIPRGDILLKENFSFSQKLFIIEALDILAKEVTDSARALNSVRNRCAHDLDYKVTEVDIDKIGRPFGKEYLEIKKKHFQTIKLLLHWTLCLCVIPIQVQSDFENK